MIYPFRVSNVQLIIDISSFDTINVRREPDGSGIVYGKKGKEVFKFFEGNSGQCVAMVDDIENMLRLKQRRF